jgi:acyl-CoA thioester hydrolase
MEHVQFTLDFQVRDYECDFQGIVNHAIYLHYLEHTRHEFAKHLGLDVVELARQGINLVVIRAELDYKHSLRSGDAFVVAISMERASRVRLAFPCKIYRKDPEELILKARLVITPVNERGRPFWPDAINRLFS